MARGSDYGGLRVHRVEPGACAGGRGCDRGWPGQYEFGADGESGRHPGRRWSFFGRICAIATRSERACARLWTTSFTRRRSRRSRHPSADPVGTNEVESGRDAVCAGGGAEGWRESGCCMRRRRRPTGTGRSCRSARRCCRSRSPRTPCRRSRASTTWRATRRCSAWRRWRCGTSTSSGRGRIRRRCTRACWRGLSPR